MPGVGEAAEIRAIFNFSGLLFALFVGFTMTDLWTRYQKVRESVALEVSAIGNYFAFAKIMGSYPKHKKWFKEQRELLDKYIVRSIQEEWENYEKTDEHFNPMCDSLVELGKGKAFKTTKEEQTYSAMLGNLSSMSDARETLIVLGDGKLSRERWGVPLALAATILFTLFYLKTATLSSIMFTGVLASVVLIIIFVIRDLNNLRINEEAVCFEPYERLLDFIGKPRFYPKEHVEAGRVKMHKGRPHRVG